MDNFLQLIQDHGDLIYMITAVWTFFEGETFVLFGGYAASIGLLDARWLLAAAWLGSFLGDQCWFLLGRRYGGRMIKRFPKWEPGVEVALDFLHRYNAKFILSFRFIYGIRNVSSIACGMSKLTWGRFAVLNFIAAGVWATAFVTVGFVFGQLSEAVLGKASRLIGLSALGVFIVVVMLVVRYRPAQLKHEVVEQGRHLDLSEIPGGEEADDAAAKKAPDSVE